MTPRAGGAPVRRRRPVADAIAEAEYRGTSAERLAELAGHASARVRQAVADAAAATDETVRLLIQDGNDLVRITAANNVGGRPSIEADVAASEDEWVRANLAHTYAQEPYKQLLRKTQEVLVGDSFREVRMRMAETTGYRDLYERLMADPEPRVRGACAWNPRVTPEDMEVLLQDRHRETRAMALDGGSGTLTHEQALRAARDPSADVRWATLFRPGAPATVAEALADDSDETVRNAAREAATQGREAIWEPAGEADAIAEREAGAGVSWER